MKYAAKIVLSFEKATFLITFFAKSLEVSRIFLNFATDSVSSFVWVSGLFTGKGRLRNVILESSNLANLNPLLKGKATRTSTKVYYILTYWAYCHFKMAMCSYVTYL